MAVLGGLVLNALAGWWWADPAAGYVLVYYTACEVPHLQPRNQRVFHRPGTQG